MSELENHLINNCTEFENYHKNRWNPMVFRWPERAAQGYAVLHDGWTTIRGTALEKAALKHLHYGPPGIHNVPG